MAKILSNIDLVNLCDSFPYPEREPKRYEEYLSNLYTLQWDDGKTSFPIGYITEPVFTKLLKVPRETRGDMEVRSEKAQICLFQQSTEAERSERAAATAAYLRDQKELRVLSGWRNELYPVYGLNNELLYNIERTATPLLGVVTYGVHMTAFVRDSTSSYGIKIWVPRRASNKQTYAGMLDNTVAGGMASGETPLECVVREADEEASLPEDLVRNTATSEGRVTYLYIRSHQALDVAGLIQPECQYIYDLELPSDVIPKPNDSEVEKFYLWTIEEVQEHMAKGEFKPNCAVIMLDFFIRHRILTPENEPNFEEIKSRLHRDLEFPGPHKIESS